MFNHAHILDKQIRSVIVGENNGLTQREVIRFQR